jgi:galactonate dehydratase
MKRRHFSGGELVGSAFVSKARAADVCGCSLFAQAAAPEDSAWQRVTLGVKITGIKVYGVSLTPDSDRLYVLVKLETNKGVVGWGEGAQKAKRPR